MAITLAQVDAAINAIVANLDSAIDYSIGDKSVSNSQRLRNLLDLRASLAQVPEVELSTITFDSSVALNGHDDTQTTVL